MEIALDMTQTAFLGVIVYIIGNAIVKRVPFFVKYCIPAPVVGGLLFSLLHWACRSTGLIALTFNGTLKDWFMIAFFSTIGFSASWKIIKSGGVAIAILFVFSSIMLVLQNVLGIAIFRAFDLNPLLGMSAGAISLMGGVGSSAAFAPILEQNGAEGALVMAITSATFGLSVSGLVSGPIARRLIDRYDLANKVRKNKNDKAVDYEKLLASVREEDVTTIESEDLAWGFFQIIIAMGIGTVISKLISMSGLIFPAYVGAIFGAAFILNFCEKFSLKIRKKEIDVLGDIFLNVFLAMTIMSLELWKLASVAVPLIITLILQVIVLALYSYFVIFNVLGRDYDAAVMAAGFYGYAMGATPNAVASMDAVVKKYQRNSPKAFFTIPMVGGFLMDFAMAILIIGHMNLILKGVL